MAIVRVAYFFDSWCKRLKSVNFQLHIPHVKNHAKFLSHLFMLSSCNHVITHATRKDIITIWT